MSPYAAAKVAGLDSSSIYQAMRRGKLPYTCSAHYSFRRSVLVERFHIPPAHRRLA